VGVGSVEHWYIAPRQEDVGDFLGFLGFFLFDEIEHFMVGSSELALEVLVEVDQGVSRSTVFVWVRGMAFVLVSGMAGVLLGLLARCRGGLLDGLFASLVLRHDSVLTGRLIRHGGLTLHCG
jgi:ABC-type dipeptide/oligopeptide/nickel transport system permease subunit